jgi:glycosyltransferase involved in cell wall biosynthesis
VSEDGADTETVKVVETLRAEGAPISHTRNSEPIGQLANRQRAFELTTGHFVAMLDDDDQWEPEFLDKTSRALSRNPDCGFCSTDQSMIDASGGILVAESRQASTRFGRTSMKDGIYVDVLRRELRDKPFPLQATLFRRSIIEKIGFFPPHAGVVPDFALFVELGARGVRGYYISERLGRYRVHPNQQTKNRVEPGEAMVSYLLSLALNRRLTRDDQELIASLFRSKVVELAIAYAHQRARMQALRSLRQYPDLGWGWPPASRIAVLVALLVGVRRHRAH